MRGRERNGGTEHTGLSEQSGQREKERDEGDALRKQGRNKESEHLRETEIATRRERQRLKGARESERVERTGARGKGGILEPGPALKYTPREMPGVN